MKILQVVPYFSPAWAYGGIVRVVYELSRELVRKGHEVTVFTTDAFDDQSRLPIPDSEHGHGVTGANVDGISVFYFRNLSNRLAYKHQLFLPYRLLGQSRKSVRKFDVIHMHGHRHLLNAIVRRRAVAAGVPYVFSAHGTLPRIERRIVAKRLFDWVTGNKVLRDAAQFTAVSQAEVKQYEQFGIAPYKVAVTYNGIDIPAYATLPERGTFRTRHQVADDHSLILYLGKITARKGIDLLIDAVAMLEGDRWRLIIAGPDHGWGDQLTRHLAQQPEAVRKRIQVIGHIGEEEKKQALRDADVVVYPSTLEVFGLVPFEALMCGSPVIVTDDNGCGEIIKQADGGWTIPYGNPQALKEAIVESTTDRTEAARRIGQGRSYILQHLAWPKIADGILRVYDTVRTHR